MSAQCRSCKANVHWIAHEKTGKRVALDPLPLMTHGTRFKVVGKGVDGHGRSYDIAATCKGSETGMRAHFASCPDSAGWRR